MVDNAHLLKRRFILSRCCLGEAVPAVSKRMLHYQNTDFEERSHPTELNGLPSWRTDGCGKALVEITLNKTFLNILSSNATKEGEANLPPAMSGTSLCSGRKGSKKGFGFSLA